MTRQEEPLTWARALEQLGRKTLEALFYRRFRRCVSSTQHTHTPTHLKSTASCRYPQTTTRLLSCCCCCWKLAGGSQSWRRRQLNSAKFKALPNLHPKTSPPQKKTPHSSYKNMQSLATSKLCMGEYYGTLLLCWVHKKETNFATNHLQKKREREREKISSAARCKNKSLEA